MADPEPRQIEWSSAQVRDGALTVGLTGHGSKAWKVRFKNVLALLGMPHATWGEVRLKKSAIEVIGMQEGTETELRHFLESVVLQANSDIQPDASETDDVGEDPGVDEQMTATFKAFAQQQED